MHGHERSFNKIFNVGLNRAGTGSLTEALKILGFRVVHFERDGKRVCDIVQENAAMGRKLLAGLDNRFDAFSDFDGYGIFDVLDRQYPNSKFIVTGRELESWLDSRERKVNANRSNPDYRYDFLTVDREGWTRDRAQFLRRISAYFQERPGDLLTLDIPAGEGWHELCMFIDMPIPDVRFPWRNRLSRTDVND